VKPIEGGALDPPSAYRFYPAQQEGGRTILRMANNTGFKFIFQQRTAKTAPQPELPDSPLSLSTPPCAS
jgi:hypothetical protein